MNFIYIMIYRIYFSTYFW